MSKKILYIIFIFIVFSDMLIAEEDSTFFDLSLGELMKTEIVSVSNYKETIKHAPASVIVVTKEEIEERGYLDLLEVFQDLPGIDLSTTYGDLYYRAYWRGLRKGVSSAFLLMQDGMVLNNLWFGWTDVLVAIPVSNVNRIEIVYGPSSSVYGANAMMGVVNIITNKNDEMPNGTNVNAKVSVGPYTRKQADVNVLTKIDKFRVSFTAMLNDGALDKRSLNQFEWTKEKYARDTSLWGDFAKQGLAGKDPISSYKHRSASLQFMYDNTEIGFQIFNLTTGNGLSYAFDKTLPSVKWIEQDINIYARHQAELDEDIISSSMIRYRRSDIPNKTYSFEQMNDAGEQRRIAAIYWETLSSSFSLQQDFDIKLHDRLSIKTGIELERKDLQKAYNRAFGPSVNPDSTNEYKYPPLASEEEPGVNRTIWEEKSIYLQTKYKIPSLLNDKVNNYIHMGIRVEDHSAYGKNYTVRAAFTGEFKSFSYKFLYGEATQEPPPRQLFGVWAGANANAKLEPEKSNNLEAVFSWASPDISIIANPFFVYIDNSISFVNNTPENIGERRNYGIDVQIHKNIQFSKSFGMKNIINYTYIKTREKKFTADKKVFYERVGDIAPHKLHVINVFRYTNNFSLAFRHRFFSNRKPYDTNPLDKIDAYYVCDMAITWKNFWYKGLGISVKLDNMLDKKYFHPGHREANSGVQAGQWENDIWKGSTGWQNSLLPQPRRSLIMSVFYKI